jgi:hypothetical protein
MESFYHPKGGPGVTFPSTYCYSSLPSQTFKLNLQWSSKANRWNFYPSVIKDATRLIPSASPLSSPSQSYASMQSRQPSMTSPTRGRLPSGRKRTQPLLAQQRQHAQGILPPCQSHHLRFRRRRRQRRRRPSRPSRRQWQRWRVECDGLEGCGGARDG